LQKLKYSEVQYNKKCSQLLKSLEDLNEHLKVLVQKSSSVEAVVAVGSTPVSIKEAFTLTTRING